MTTSLPISPAEAAHIAKVSRRTIMRAIENNEIKAFRDNRNRWKIAVSDINKWAGAHWAPSGRAHPETPTLPTSETADFSAVKAEINTLRERLEAALNRAIEAETDRDHWRTMAENLVRQSRRWWRWW